jgi:metal transporter CNNM
MIVNETLPVIADPVLGGGIQAVVASTALIIIFAEIIPQSICTRYGLLVGAKAAPLTQILIYVMCVSSMPSI